MSGFVKIAIDDYYSDSNWTTIVNKYWMLVESVSDPRVHGWFLFDTPLPTLAMVIAYLAFVIVVGPLWMANRKPFKLHRTLVAYNAAQVLLSAYMFFEHLMAGWWADYSLTCEPVDYSESDKARRMLTLCWVYYFSKLSEFADTVFFVLRKKKSQITWLHLYHHSLTPFEAWLLVKFIGGGHGTFSNIVNNLVHVFMYTYYMVAAMGPQYYKFLWWKKHITILQLVQFFLVLFHSISALVCDCGYPKIIAAGLILHSVIFIVLFMNFYMQAYKKTLPKRHTTAINNNNVDVQHTEDGVVKNGIANGAVNNGIANAALINGIANGELKNGIAYGALKNGLANGELKNGIANGALKNGIANGELKNGITNGTLKNGIANGVLKNGFANGVLNNGTINGVLKHGEINSTLKNRQVNGILKNEEVNGIIKNEELNEYCKNGQINNGMNGILKVNSHLSNGYTNGINEVTDKEKVQ